MSEKKRELVAKIFVGVWIVVMIMLAFWPEIIEVLNN